MFVYKMATHFTMEKMLIVLQYNLLRPYGYNVGFIYVTYAYIKLWYRDVCVCVLLV